MTSSNALASERTDDKHASYWTTSEAAGFDHGPYQQFTLPTRPPPTLQVHSQSPTLRSATLTPSDSSNTLTPDPTLLYDNSSLPYKDLSLSSSASTSFAMTPISSNELEKSSVSTKDSDNNTKRDSLRKSSSNARDPEKGHHAPSSRRTSSTPQRPRRTVDPHLTSAHLRYSLNSYASAEDPQRRIYEASAGRILLFLSLPCVVLSLLNALWTLIAIFITLLTQPVRLCARRPSFGQQLAGLVGPALNLHLRCICTPLPPHADEDCSWKSGSLVATQMLSPLLAFGMMVAAWVVAVFWLTSAMIGDPSGKEDGEHHHQQQDDDGRDTVLALRGWWERWLARSMVE